MSLSSIVAKLRELRDYVLERGPDALDTAADFLGDMKDVLEKMADYARSFTKVQGGKRGAKKMTKSDEEALEDLKAFQAELGGQVREPDPRSGAPKATARGLEDKPELLMLDRVVSEFLEKIEHGRA